MLAHHIDEGSRILSGGGRCGQIILPFVDSLQTLLTTVLGDQDAMTGPSSPGHRHLGQK